MIQIEATRSAALVAAGEENNPVLTGANLAESLTTVIGTEVTSAAYAGTPSTHEYWSATPDGSSESALQSALGASTYIGFAAIARHNLSDVGASVAVEYSTDSGGTWSDCGAGAVTPATNDPIAWRFVMIDADYWRLKITGATGDVSVAVFHLGNEIVMPSRMYQDVTPPITPSSVDILGNYSETGEIISVAYAESGSSVSASFTYVSPSFVRGATWKEFQRAWNRGRPAFWAWRPGKYGDLQYIQRSGDAIAPTNSGPGEFMSFSLSARAHHV